MVFKAVGKTKVPTDLFPNDVEKVKGIVAADERK